MIKVPKEHREKKRVGISLDCAFTDEKGEHKRCTTFDLSRGGMCIFSGRELESGHKVNIDCKDLWDEPRTGTIKWCHKIQLNLYRVGISFE